MSGKSIAAATARITQMLDGGIELAVGLVWQEIDMPGTNIIPKEIVDISRPYQYPIRGKRVLDGVCDVMLRNTATGRTTKARTHDLTGRCRFNGKRGGYKLISGQ